jgi:hypothetical protein
MRAVMSSMGTSISSPTPIGSGLVRSSPAGGALLPLLVGASAAMLVFAALTKLYEKLFNPAPAGGANGGPHRPNKPGASAGRFGSIDFGVDDASGSSADQGPAPLDPGLSGVLQGSSTGDVWERLDNWTHDEEEVAADILGEAVEVAQAKAKAAELGSADDDSGSAPAAAVGEGFISQGMLEMLRRERLTQKPRAEKEEKAELEAEAAEEAAEAADEVETATAEAETEAEAAEAEAEVDQWAGEVATGKVQVEVSVEQAAARKEAGYVVDAGRRSKMNLQDLQAPPDDEPTELPEAAAAAPMEKIESLSAAQQASTAAADASSPVTTAKGKPKLTDVLQILSSEANKVRLEACLLLLSPPID